MHSNLSFDNWAELLTFRPVSSQHSLLNNTPGNPSYPRVWTRSCTSCRSHPRSSVHLRTANTARLFQSVENLQFPYKLARRNLKERTDKQAVVNETLPFPSFKCGEQVLIHRPYNEADGSSPKHIGPWRGPYIVRAQMSPVIYRVTRDGNPTEITVHLGRMKEKTLSLCRPLSPTSMPSTICS